MNLDLRGIGRQTAVAVRMLIALTVVSIAYLLLITGIGQLAFPSAANGSPVTSGGKVVGSALIGQSFTTGKGVALPRWFQSRPSAAGTGYDAGASSGSNLGPNDPDLVKSIKQRRAAVAKTDGVPASAVPADAVTASGSGLDPHVSPATARLQAAAVARARGIDPATVRRLVERFVQPADLGYLGQSTVNVLRLNLALAKMDPSGNG